MMKFLVVIIILVALGVGAYLVFKPNANLPSTPNLPNPLVSQQAKTLPKEVEVSLDSQNDSNQLGVATLQKVDGKLVVKINLKGEDEEASEPAHIHSGACPNPGEVKYNLNPVVKGYSETTLDISGDELVGMMPLAINVHTSLSEIKTYVACGDIKL